MAESASPLSSAAAAAAAAASTTAQHLSQHAVAVDRASSSSSSPVAADAPVRPLHYYAAHLTGIWRQRWYSSPQAWREYVTNMPKRFGLTAEEERKIRTKNVTYVETPPLSPSRSVVGSTLIISAVSAFSKLLLTRFNTLHMFEMHNLYNAIERRPKGQGLLTVSNHKSVIDDPFLLSAILPARILLRAKEMRWGLCSLDICFQNALISRTLRLGKALPIERRGGLDQPFLQVAAEKLADASWLHIYPEGRVRQQEMGYSKRGVGKIVADAYERTLKLPLVIPIFHQGVENVAPQNPQTHKLESAIPRRAQHIYVMAGEPVDIAPIFEQYMPACAVDGGVQSDSPNCIRLYEEVADFLAIAVRLVRTELRKKVRQEHQVDLGDPYEMS